MQALSEISPVLAYVLGAATIALPLALWAWRFRAEERRRRRRLSAVVRVQREVIAAAPEGLFLWDHVTAKQSCSRRLAVLLNLSQGAASGFADVLSRFEGEAAETLDASVARLRHDGAGFELSLPACEGQRQVSILGVRVNLENGAPLADLLWMRDADGHAITADEEKPASEPFKPLLDILPFPVWLRDANFNIVFANPACAAEDVTGPARDLAARAMASGRAESEDSLLTIDEKPRLFEVTETPLEGWGGSAGFAVDRSAVEKTEGERARQDAAGEQVLENLSIAIAIYDDGARLKYFNSAYAEQWGLAPAWLDGAPGFSEVLDKLRTLRKLPEVPDFRAFKEEQLSLFRILEAPKETLIHLPDGASLRAVVSPYALGGLVFAYEDVSDRLDLERSYNTLVAVQRETLDNMYEGVAVFGGDGRLKLNNPVFAKLWNLDEEELDENLRLTDFVEKMRPYLTHVDDWETHKSRMMRRLMSRETGGGRLERADGKVLDYSNVPLPDGAALLSYLDVSDSAKVEQALRLRAQALEDADRLKSEFISNVSFELRTPLTTLMGFAEIMNHEYFGALNARQMEYSQGILDSAKGLMTVIADILDLASIEAGKVKLNVDTVDLHAILVSVLSLIRERARNKSIHLKFDCAADMGWITADEQRLKQVLFNLLSNAVNFTPKHGTITLSARRKENEMIIKVIDTGAGVPKADQEKVFNAFERGSASNPGSNPGQGSGLGLTLVKRFIELHGGAVELKSTANGTTISCRLPVGGPGEN